MTRLVVRTDGTVVMVSSGRPHPKLIRTLPKSTVSRPVDATLLCSHGERYHDNDVVYSTLSSERWEPPYTDTTTPGIT